MAKESPKPPKSDSKISKKEEKKKKKDMKKSKESLVPSIDIEPTTPRNKKKDKKASSPGKDSVGSSTKKKGIFKRIGSFMLPTQALAASPSAQQERINMSQSCQDLDKSRESSRGALGSPDSIGYNSASSPNLLSPPLTSMPPPSPSSPPTQHSLVHRPPAHLEEIGHEYKTLIVNRTESGKSFLRVRSSSLAETRDSHASKTRDSVSLSNSEASEGNEVSCTAKDVVKNNTVACQTEKMDLVRKEKIRLSNEQNDEECVYENYDVPRERRISRDMTRSDSIVSVEYAMPLRNFSSDDEGSPRRSTIRSSPSPRKDRHISFAEEDDQETRVLTPELLKRNLVAELTVPLPPGPTYADDVIDIPEASDLNDLPLEERCEQQGRLLGVYEEKIHQFRDQVLAIVSENTRLQKMCTQRGGVHDIESLQKQAKQVLQENRNLIKEQQMNEARWHDLIEERNQEVLRMRATCTNLEDQNSTLVKRCEKLENRNEEFREAYNNIVTQADDFVPVSAHLSSMEGYKVALEELRKRYDGSVHDKNEEIASLEASVSTLSERVEVTEEDNAIMLGQVKGLRDALEKAQHNATKHKREAVQLTERVNTLKTSLSQAIAIAEESTLKKLEFAEILQISEIQEQQNRSHRKLNSDFRVKEVKKIANAKLKSCAEILQERETEHEQSISKLNGRITKLKMRCHNKDEIIQNFSNPEYSATPPQSS